MKQGDVMRGTITVVGLGLMGGSFALAMQKAAPVRLVGLDNDPDVLMQALKRRAIDEAANDDLLRETDMLVLALPPRTAVEVLKEMAQR